MHRVPKLEGRKKRGKFKQGTFFCSSLFISHQSNEKRGVLRYVALALHQGIVKIDENLALAAMRLRMPVPQPTSSTTFPATAAAERAAE